MELNENRRKARSLLSYFEMVSGKNGNQQKDGLQVVNFFTAKNMLLKVNEIPLKIKAEIRKEPEAVWKNYDEITEILKKLCEEKSEDKKLNDFEKQENALDKILQMISGGSASAGGNSGQSGSSGSSGGNQQNGNDGEQKGASGSSGANQQSENAGQQSSDEQQSQSNGNKQGQSVEKQTAENDLQNGDGQNPSDENPDAQLQQQEQNQQQSQPEDNKQFLDAIVDYFDETVPEELKNQFTEKQKLVFEWICQQIGEEKLNFIKKHEGLLLDTIQSIIDSISETDYSKLKKKISDFNGKMNDTMNLEEMLEPFMTAIGIGLNELFQNKGFAELQKYGLILEKQKEIKELAEMLGHQESDDKETEKNARDAVKHIESKYHPRPSFRGNIVGFTYSGDIGKVVPTEMALLKNPATEMLFYHKFAEKQLLSYDYVMNLRGEVNDDKRLKKGPIIMAVDTSGSMNGQPEKIAKIVAFAVTKIALKEKRKCFLISFSSSIEVLDLSDFSGGSGLKKLIDFLSHSFNGGTDIEPCIDAALKKLEENDFTNADILVISDFEMYDFEKKTVQRIEKQKETGTKLYSLLIGRDPNRKTLSYFDEQWTYKGKKDEKMTFIRELKNKI